MMLLSNAKLTTGLPNKKLKIHCMTISSSSERDGNISMVFFVAYDELGPDDEGDELPVTIPQIKFEIPFDTLTPRLR